jgi:hypothetical protein
VFLQAEGVDGHGGAIAVGGAAQHAVARGIVDISFLVVTPGIPFDQLVEVVVGEDAGGAAERADGNAAPGVAAGIALPALARAGGPRRIQTHQLVRMAAIAVEVLVLRAAAVKRTLPQLPQVDVNILFK